MFTTKVSADSRDALLNRSRLEREKRDREKQQQGSVVIIQKHVRRWLSNVRLCRRWTEEYHALPQDAPATTLLISLRRLLFAYRPLGPDSSFLCEVCERILGSMEGRSPERWYVRLVLTRQSKDAITQTGQVLQLTLEDLRRSGTGNGLGDRDTLHRAATYLRLYEMVCDPSSWLLYEAVKSNELAEQVLTKYSATACATLVSGGVLSVLQGLLNENCSRREPVLPSSLVSSLSHLLQLILRASGHNESIWLASWMSVLSTPAVLSRLSAGLVRELTDHVMVALATLSRYVSEITTSCSREQILFILLNSVQLLHTALSEGQAVKYPTIIATFHTLLKGLVGRPESRESHWHPLLGITSTPVSAQLTNSLNLLTGQIRLLHSQAYKKFFFEDLLAAEFPTGKAGGGLLGDVLGKVPGSASWKQLFGERSRESRLVRHVSAVAALYNTTISTFYLHKMDVLMSLCCFPDFLSSLWALVYTEHSASSKSLARNMVQEKTDDPFVPLLLLFCSCFGQYVVVMSDAEIYDLQKPFTLKQLGLIGDFVNSMLFNVIWNHCDAIKAPTVLDRVTVCHSLLIPLTERDQRRQFTTSPKFWTPRDSAPAAILAELKAGKDRANRIADYLPWVLPNKRKLEYLHDTIRLEKQIRRPEGRVGDRIPAAPVLVKIHRRRLFEDGFQQIRNMADLTFRHSLKIMFVNEYGLDEVGIDQDGVLKEFLEETIRYALDPSFGLFAVTEENHLLYPSPLSKIHTEHLELFHYIGRIVAKAVFEGVVVDISFAPFFIRQLLHNKNALFSYLDELPSLDSELHKNLIFIKTYAGDAQDLGLTFSMDEEEFGKIVSEELMPGGSVTPVTNTNKISYIHQVAHYKMYTQIKKQTRAFCAGFKSVIQDDWLRMFSLPELQKLVSGDCSSIDLSDLRKNVRYLGGYHGSHRVILWFWDIALNEFSETEKSALLKFVTSCSRPPLMGFASLSPPFSIRAVDDEEQEPSDMTPGEALRSSFKSFLGLSQGSGEGGSSRLPSSSTCFNLLKLPVYRSKAVLREKLRYAINSGAGFELS